MTTYKSLLLSFALAVFLSGNYIAPARGETAINTLERFQLWNNCEPMRLIVENMNFEATKIGLTEDAITTMARSRLRAARLYDDEVSNAIFHINVSVSSQAFSFSVDLNKDLFDIASNTSLYAKTWTTGSFGTHGTGTSIIMSGLSQSIDEFIDEYLRVNASACK